MIISELDLHTIREELNIRRQYDNIEELANSIELIGLLNPITVRKQDNHYVVITGHRRLHAYRLLNERHKQGKYAKIPAIITSEDNTLIKQVIENVQRDDLTPYELYLSLKALSDAGIKMKDIATIIGKSYGYVKHLFSTINAIDRSGEIYVSMLKDGITLSAMREVFAATEDDNERVAMLQQIKDSRMKQKDIRRLKARQDKSKELLEVINQINDPDTLVNITIAILNKLDQDSRAKIAQRLR